MSLAQAPPAYVAKADGDSVSVKSTDPNTIAFLARSGFQRSRDDHDLFVKAVENDAAKAQLFIKLRDRDVSFSVGREWSPAEVFEWLREKRYLSGEFTAIAWKGPGDWFLRKQ